MNLRIPAAVIALAFLASTFSMVHVANVVPACAGCVGVPTLDVDIKYGSDPNGLNINKNGLLPVTIFGNADVDVMELDCIEIAGVSVAERGPKKDPKLAISYEDVNGDGIMDMVVFFEVQDLVGEGVLYEGVESLEISACMPICYEGPSPHCVPACEANGEDSVKVIV